MSSDYRNGKFEIMYGGKDYCYLTTPDNLVTMFFNREKRQAVIRRVNMVGMLMYNENQYDLVLDETSNSFSYNLDDFEELWNEFWGYWNKKSPAVQVNESLDPKVYYMRHGIKFICRESQCKKRGIEGYSKLED